MWLPVGAVGDPDPTAGVGLAGQTRPLSVLLVEDDRGDALLVEELVADADIDIRMVWAPTMADAEAELARMRPDCVLLDLNLPDANGIAALDHVTACDPAIPIVVLTGLNDEHFGVSALASGAQDYLVKGRVEAEMLRRALLYAIERKRAETTSADLRSSQLGPRRTRAWNAACCRRRCCSTSRASRSSRSTVRAGRTPCSAATSTTSSRRRTGPCT